MHNRLDLLADPLWPVLIDEDQIGQVIFQLLQNARQAMPEGGQVTRRESAIKGPVAEERRKKAS